MTSTSHINRKEPGVLSTSLVKPEWAKSDKYKPYQTGKSQDDKYEAFQPEIGNSDKYKI